jgi:hypothetical protein
MTADEVLDKYHVLITASNSYSGEEVIIYEDDYFASSERNARGLAEAVVQALTTINICKSNV